MISISVVSVWRHSYCRQGFLSIHINFTLFSDLAMITVVTGLRCCLKIILIYISVARDIEHFENRFWSFALFNSAYSFHLPICWFAIIPCYLMSAVWCYFLTIHLLFQVLLVKNFIQYVGCLLVNTDSFLLTLPSFATQKKLILYSSICWFLGLVLEFLVSYFKSSCLLKTLKVVPSAFIWKFQVLSKVLLSILYWFFCKVKDINLISFFCR